MRIAVATSSFVAVAGLACAVHQQRTQRVTLVVASEARVAAASDDYGELTQDGCRLLCGRVDAEDLDVVEVERVVSCDRSPDTADTGNLVDPGEVAVLCSILAVEEVGCR